MAGESFNPLKGLFDLAGKAIDAKAASYGAGAFDAHEAPYGADDSGRAFIRGGPSGQLLGVSPLVLVGAGVLAVALVLMLKK